MKKELIEQIGAELTKKLEGKEPSIETFDVVLNEVLEDYPNIQMNRLIITPDVAWTLTDDDYSGGLHFESDVNGDYDFDDSFIHTYFSIKKEVKEYLETIKRSDVS